MPVRRRGTLARRHAHRRVSVPRDVHASFEELVERAVAALPDPFRTLLANVAIVIEEEPSPEQLGSAETNEEGTLYGLYEGTPATEYGADWVAFPNKISLFRLPLEGDFPDPAELAWEVQRTVVHELAHHAGIGEDRLTALGFD